MKSLLSIVALFLMLSPAMHAADAPRPNILWLVCEDSSVDWFGCYGSKEAKTPNIDALAKQGFRYNHVYASAPVCAPSRSTWITGINAVSTGTQPMRSRYPIPHDLIKYYPDYLRKAGYFTANFPKTDYNIGGRPDPQCWDLSKSKAWEVRKPGQPFFQVINFGSSHESAAHGSVTNTIHSPKDVTLTKFHPDELGIRQTYAKYHDAVSTMDSQIGKTLAEIEKAGLADDTIVIFNSDHGGVMPRSKRFLYDSGTHCPLIIRIPEKFKAMWPAATPGATIDRLVSFLDMTKTWLSIANAEVPPVMQGRIFLGAKAEPEPEYVFAFRERMDERFDHSRSVRNKNFVYIKNYMPYVSWGQHLEYLWKMQATVSWEQAYKNGRTNAVTGRFFEAKPSEELYDTVADPDNVVNLADKPEHRKTLETMRGKLREWQLAIHDSGLLPEAERERRAVENKTTIYRMVRDPKLYDLASYLDSADLALTKNEANRKPLLELLKRPDAAHRYWGIVGLFMLGKADGETQTAIQIALKDHCGEVATMAAWTMIQEGKVEQAQQTLIELMKKHDPATLLVLNVLDWSKVDLKPYFSTVTAIPGKGTSLADMEQRMVVYFREVTNSQNKK